MVMSFPPPEYGFLPRESETPPSLRGLRKPVGAKKAAP